MVKCLGGFWRLKERCNTCPPGFVRSRLIGLYRGYQKPFGSSIAWNSKFDGPPCLPHGMHGIFVSATSKVGKNCVIFQQVTIGANTLVDSKGIGAPVIGDHCYIGAGAKIIGKVVLGKNVRVGANCVVYSDVPDNAVVVSAEQKIVRRDVSPDNRFHAYEGGTWRFFDNGRWIDESDPAVIKALEFCTKAYDE